MQGKQGYLVVDEIYQGLIYENECLTALSYSDDVFVINSFSKYFGMTGWRLGWMVVPERFVDAVDRIVQNLFLAPPTMSQYAAIAAFAPESIEILEQRVATFKQRRDYLLSVLPDLRFKLLAEPKGAFYIYANCDEITADTFLWTQQLLELQGVALTPGVDFTDFEANRYVRFAYTRPIAELKVAVERIRNYINECN